MKDKIKEDIKKNLSFFNKNSIKTTRKEKNGIWEIEKTPKISKRKKEKIM